MRRFAATAATLALAGALLAGCTGDGPDGALDDFLAGWRANDLSKVGFVSAAGGKLASADVQAQLKELTGELVNAKMTVTKTGEPKTTGDDATHPIKLEWKLPGDVTWSYDSTVRLTKRNTDGWSVIWEPALVQSDLVAGDKVRLVRVPATRASVLDAAGQPIVTAREVVTIGVVPQNITDLAKLQKDLTTALARVGVTVDMADLATRVKASDPGAFVDVVTLRRPDYLKIRNEVRPLKGTQFQEAKRDLAPTRAFARALLGTADQATRDDIDENPQKIVQGDVVGHGGLQEKYDATLRGTTGLSVVVSRPTSESDDTPKDTEIFTAKPVAGKPIKTTIDVKTQLAADQALASIKQPSSLVAVKISDGAVLAVANGPDGGTVDTALTGQVPPGSTFKAVSAYGLLQRKAVTANATVACPAKATVAGREFKNADGEVLGNVPFHVDFAKSCNTAFVALAPKLGADGLQKAATDLGLGGKWDLGVETFSGKVSPAATPTELAAATFGQGATAVSPLAMASATAAIARGQFKQPKLVLDPAPAAPAADGPKLDEAAVTPLRQMMREVVTAGTGTALKSTPGGPVHGKTGTAEFSEETEDTHSWFIGYQGDIAFAVMVQKGGAGSEAAVPAVDRFLRALAK
ncbi:penicillin-binding transpeptidase domain-containing protein [Paractinoplanes atraurantiacus]|uniref:Cell division protein FtsI/penicillin-binding protein 2 n=1 Tax=Paractinoplanes atraurantiacus TaxID=1036182 RepID=A0A285FK29_9ACTN|nr:penicillin-binding transpeptidase domain-containing protein [Actinoplanes atraurantiacus]SNY11443.1 Cell division protein FtsI/penicillin-binding protein 2 [Actinoplanes atraurantiacus]